MIWVGYSNLGVIPLIHPLGAVSPHRSEVARSHEALTDESDVFLIIHQIVHVVSVDVRDLNVDRVCSINEASPLRGIV